MRENSSGMAGSVLLLVSASHFLNDMLQSIIPASLPLLKEENNLTFAEVGLITLVIQLTASLLQPVIGFSTDKRPMPMALPFGMMLSLIGLLFLAHSGTLSLILFSVALIGCGSAVFHPALRRKPRAAGEVSLRQSFRSAGTAAPRSDPLPRRSSSFRTARKASAGLRLPPPLRRSFSSGRRDGAGAKPVRQRKWVRPGSSLPTKRRPSSSSFSSF